MSPKKVRVYLAGGFVTKHGRPDYKRTISDALPERFVLHDPDDGEALPGYYVGQDLDAVRNADLVIAYQDAYAVTVLFKDGTREEYTDAQLTNGGLLVFDIAAPTSWQWFPPQAIDRVIRKGA